MSKLIIRPELKENESLLGYMLRLTEGNVFQTILSLVRLGQLNNKDEQLSVNDYIKLLVSSDISLEKLGYISGELEIELNNRRYPLIEKGIEGCPDTHLFLETRILGSFLRFYYPRFCPDCMKEDSYHRFYWDFVPLTCCPIHKKLLMDVCPQCHKQVNWSLSSISTCQCGYDLFQDEGIDVPEEQLEHVYLTARILNDVDAITFQPLKTIDFQGLNLPPENYSRYHNIHTLRDLHEYLVEKILFQNSSTRKKMRDEFQWQPNAEIHQKMVKLFTGKDAPLLIDYTKTGRLSTTQHARHIGIKNSAARLAISLSQGPLSSNSSSLETRNDIINSSTAAEQFGISEHLLKQLISAGLLTPTSSRLIDGYGDYLFSKMQLDKFIETLANLIDRNNTRQKAISVDAYLKTFDIKRRKPLADIIKATLKGEINVLKVPSNRLTDVLLDISAIERFCPPLSKNPDYLSVKDVANEMDIYTDAIYRTIQSGLLPHTITGKTKLIHKDDVDKFRKNYLFIKEIASEYKCNPTNLAEKLIDEGLKPISGPSVDNNLVYIFKRKEIASIDLPSVIAKEKYKTQTGRIGKSKRQKSYHQIIEQLSLITTSQAAEIIGISIQKLSILIRNEQLNIEENKQLPSYKKYLRHDEVTRYLALYRNNPQLVTLSEAALILEESDDRFFNNWLKYQRLEVLNDGLGNKYVYRTALNEIKAFKKIAMSAADAADFWNIDRSYFSNQRKLGHLIPISGPGIDDYGNYFYARHDIESIDNENWW